MVAIKPWEHPPGILHVLTKALDVVAEMPAAVAKMMAVVTEVMAAHCSIL